MWLDSALFGMAEARPGGQWHLSALITREACQLTTVKDCWAGRPSPTHTDPILSGKGPRTQTYRHVTMKCQGVIALRALCGSRHGVPLFPRSRPQLSKRTWVSALLKYRHAGNTGKCYGLAHQLPCTPGSEDFGAY